jgi:SHS2 domain-containing protein
MTYGWAEHVGELELWVEAPDEAAVFAEALRALGELLASEGGPGRSDDLAAAGSPDRLDVVAAGQDRATLFASWLEELVFLAETEGFVPAAVEDLVLEPERVRARVAGRRGSPPHLVKAVTYHRLSFEPVDGGWRAAAVLDV